MFHVPDFIDGPIKPGKKNIPEHPGTWNKHHNYEKNNYVKSNF